MKYIYNIYLVILYLTHRSEALCGAPPWQGGARARLGACRWQLLLCQCDADGRDSGGASVFSSCDLASLSSVALESFEEVCRYLATFPELFASWFDTYWGTFDEYIRHLRRDGSYADDLCCVAASHLLLRPLRVITDIAGQGVIEFFPPNSIAPTAWGPPLVLAYYLKGRHYARGGAVSALEAKSSGDGRWFLWFLEGFNMNRTPVHAQHAENRG